MLNACLRLDLILSVEVSYTGVNDCMFSDWRYAVDIYFEQENLYCIVDINSIEKITAPQKLIRFEQKEKEFAQRMTSIQGNPYSSNSTIKKATSVSQGTIPLKTETKLNRFQFPDHPRLINSPISSVYDVCNSSTCLILLNNKFSTKSKGSRLRGQTNIKRDIVKPEPERHSVQNPERRHSHYHQKCLTPDPQTLIPVLPDRPSHLPSSTRRAQDTSLKLYHDPNAKILHHINCQGNGDIGSIMRPKRNKLTRVRTSFRNSLTLNEVLGGSGLSQGDKYYLSTKMKVYSVDDMRKWKQIQCYQLLWDAFFKGSYKYQDLVNYSRYISQTCNTKFRPHTSVQQKHLKTGRRRRGRSNTHKWETESQTTHSDLRSSTEDLSDAASDHFNPQKRQTTNEVVSDQHVERKSTQNSKRKLQDMPGKSTNKEQLLSLMLKITPQSSMPSTRK